MSCLWEAKQFLLLNMVTPSDKYFECNVTLPNCLIFCTENLCFHRVCCKIAALLHIHCDVSKIPSALTIEKMLRQEKFSYQYLVRNPLKFYSKFSLKYPSGNLSENILQNVTENWSENEFINMGSNFQ